MTSKYISKMREYIIHVHTASTKATTGSTANAGQNYATNAGNTLTGMGNAAASGYIGGANAISGGVNNFLRSWNEQQLLDKYLRP